MNKQITDALNSTFTGIEDAENSSGEKLIHGKVREIFDLNDSLVLTTSDRISAFDRILSTIPYKGQVLNQLSLYWFKNTEDIVANHIAAEVSPRTIAVKKCEVLPVEIIIRGYLTGSAWRDYKAGNAVSGITLPQGMKMDQKFETPLITPSTKAEQGDHDMPISCEEIVKKGLVEESLWKKVEETALALFKRGSELAAKQGLILVDTKYEMGLYNGELVVVDEVHTPDSSRFWYADTYEEYFAAGKSQKKVDKEFLREWLMDKGFMGEGEAPEIPDSMRVEIAQKYIEAYELITGEKFVPTELSPEAEKEKILTYINNR